METGTWASIQLPILGDIKRKNAGPWLSRPLKPSHFGRQGTIHANGICCNRIIRPPFSGASADGLGEKIKVPRRWLILEYTQMLETDKV